MKRGGVIVATAVATFALLTLGALAGHLITAQGEDSFSTAASQAALQTSRDSSATAPSRDASSLVRPDDRDDSVRPASPKTSYTSSEHVTSPPNTTGVQIISTEEAVQAARAILGQAPITKVELEWEHGIPVYEVKSGEKEVYVDARTGTVLRYKLPSSRSDSYHYKEKHWDDD